MSLITLLTQSYIIFVFIYAGIWWKISYIFSIGNIDREDLAFDFEYLKRLEHIDVSSCDDSILAVNCAQGDVSSQEELYKRYGGRILSLCLRYSRDLPEAEDFMHDAFVRIFHKIGKFKWSGQGSLYSWMSRVTINLCFDSYKKRRRLAEQLSDSMEDFDVLEGEVPGVLPDIPLDKIKEMVERLPEAYGTVFKLHVVDGLSHKEIGNILGIKESSSSSNFARARAKLIKQINDFVKQAEK